MFRKLFQKIFNRKVSKDPLKPLLDSIAPRNFGLEIVKMGNSKHDHLFVRVEWNRERFGSDFCNPDPDPGTTIAFPMATYKYLFRCQCGAEGIKSIRALI